MRRFSLSTEPLSSWPENQPETSFKLWAARIGPRTFGSIGNLPPVSVPLKPAARLSVRQVSSGVSPPSCGRSSLDQAMGAMPRRTGMSDSDALLLLALGVIGRGLAHALARIDLGHADVPPGVARRPLRRAHLDLDHIGAVGLLGALEGLLKVRDRGHPLGQRAHGLGMLGEVD